MKPAACTALVVLLAACAEAPAATPGSATAGPAPAGGFELRMQRSGCYGRCPTYQLVLHADGTVDYRSGAASRQNQADANAFAALRQRLADPSLPWGDYTRSAPAACGVWSSDMPGVSIEAYVGKRWRSIRHDLGCTAAPPALKALEQAIDAAAGVDGGQAVE